ncbi:alkaline phosphatase D family protein [Sphaerotilus sp.]|uniref:alkaline phosphatase D family protein n=1 Tax=Sphaerotilus sp. TaxID=2093942 RepID=UPI00286DB6BC|nr:alkaline phosphatase D family protein [Sphaerotilus sp.]
MFSCAHYGAGYFNVYAAAAQREDLDAVLHLGDYLYEYGRDGYANEQAAALGRLVLPATELLTLADYRQRHAQVRTDADLQVLHASVAMIAVWDDHEIANDTWRAGADNHTAATEGAFTTRRAAAVQAWHEWLPVRSGADRLSMHMLDPRVLARDQQLDYANFLTATGLNAAAFTSRRRSCWTRWCRARASASRATRRSSRKPPVECRADWVYVSTVASRTYTVVSDKALRVLPGVGNRKVVV